MEKAQIEIYKTIDTLVKEHIKNLKFDITKKGVVKAIDKELRQVDVLISGNTTTCSIGEYENIEVNDIVYITLPQGNFNERFISNKKI